MSDDELYHYGTARHSGRYPWGSGKDPYQSGDSFLATVAELKAKGLTEAEIAKGLGISTTQLRARKAIVKNANRKEDMAMAMRLKQKGYSNVAIGDRMGINESSVRSLLDPQLREQRDILENTADMLKESVDSKGFIDIGAGVENQIGVSREKLQTAASMLQQEGYTVHYVKVQQLGTGQFTTIKVLAPPNTPYSEVFNNQDKIKTLQEYSEDGGRTFFGIHPPENFPSSRLEVLYGNEGGIEKDGVIELRRGVDDISLGSANYAQVRIAVDGKRYLKGMAMYSDDLPPGVDIRFNTNKPNTGNKLNALKPLKDDPDNPFGAVIKPGGQKGVINIVNEEGDWSKWSKNLSSQMLSKQSPILAKKQLGLAFDSKKEAFDEINALTNPAVKKKLMGTFADECDSAAVHLKAAALPRLASHVILPVPSLKETEIYAPNYRNGEKVVLIRHPHGGKFEIPELTVNNRHSAAKAALGKAKDAVGINAKVAERLSGADFDGDTVLVIPNNSGRVKTSPALSGLKDFDPKRAYPAYPGMPKMSKKAKQQKMGDISNLITDMTIKGASTDEIARAVRHSMVVIDAETHNLNYKQSYVDNGVAALKKKYQGKASAGASTLISRASSETRVPEVKGNYKIDPKTGAKVYTKTNASYVDSKGKTVYRTTKSTKMAETSNAFSLSSGTPMESVYATHANKLKALGNTARKVVISTPSIRRSPSAAKTYSKEVSSLSAKLNEALKNAPRERQAQLLANTVVKNKIRDNPNMDPQDIKKIKGQALTEARTRMGAKKPYVDITAREWEAIQSGAISNNKLESILNNTDLDKVKALATPRTALTMTPAKIGRAKSMLQLGYTQAEVADALGVSATTINKAVA